MALTRASAAVIKTEEIVNNRNRIINGDMRIDQRNAGASKSIPSGDSDGNVYTVDRWIGRNNTDGVFSVQQDSSVPAGFNTSSKITVTTADASIGAAQRARFNQRIEGFNIADLGWGTANAKTVTLSFWVRLTLTGTFAGHFTNSVGSRNNVFTYTISVADTWEYKTVTLSGDTSGTWQTTTSTGIDVTFTLAAGSNFNGTAGVWTSSDHRSVSGAVQVLSTLNATWYITGVQLEVGSVATPFERRPRGTELALCQRYYQKSYPQATVPGTLIGANSGLQHSFGTAGTGIVGSYAVFPVVMRASPTLTVYDNAGNSARVTTLDGGAAVTDNVALSTSNATETRVMARIFGVSAAGMSFMYTVSAEL